MLFAIVVFFYFAIWSIIGFVGYLFWESNEGNEFPAGLSWPFCGFYGVFTWTDGYIYHKEFFPDDNINLINALI